MYELKLKQFSGPIEKLLELIEEKKLNITELNLAEVTADFLNYLKTVEKLDPKALADFLVVAAKLLLIKSKALLPDLKLTQEEETEIKDFTRRLIICKEFIEKNRGSISAESELNVGTTFIITLPNQPINT